MTKMIRSPRLALSILAAVFFLAGSRSANAQWVTQTVEIKAGWNSVYLHVDPSHLLLDDWIGGDLQNPITQVWRWTIPTTAQFVDSFSEPSDHVSGWASWVRNRDNSALTRMVGNTAFLVESAEDYTWEIKGRPLVPLRKWDIKGLNLIGFPTDRDTPPTFSQFLAEAPELQSTSVDVFEYRGPDLEENNPVRVPPSLFRLTPVTRGKAFWIRSGTVFNRYFGPFEIVLTSQRGVKFSENLNIYSLWLRNLSPHPLTVSMELSASESAPDGQTVIDGLPPLLLRGPLDISTQLYDFEELNAGSASAKSWQLAARNEIGSEVEVVIGLDRTSITEPVGSFLAGLLTFSDSLGHTEIDVGVSGTVASDAGLWVGDALVTQVGQYLKQFERGAADPIVIDLGNSVVTNDLIISSNGQYVVSSINTDMTDVSKLYPLRMIVHKPETGQARLLQRVYYGLSPYSNTVISRVEAALDPAELDSARRISASHLPWDADNAGWSLLGAVERGRFAIASVTTEFDDQRSNPFLHTYHPDHDNLDATFGNELTQGSESYEISRSMLFVFDDVGATFESRVSGGRSLTGEYRETLDVTGLARAGGTNDRRRFEIQGVFKLNRISNIPVLTDPP